ncbi:hypothetical protein BBK82_13070 [Lentzea guizhouensis]|uniref:Oxidoreductase n=1 Tax=Lentzea guizhouensis TaxID=1586287 RepID=A0A1B2HGL5_9PSEU|nr:hypothetical protein BBK82_13070 [Lentzea guizhouensis]
MRAELIRELLMGRRGELDPRGVLIRGVRVIGRLNLDRVTAVTGLALDGCALSDGIECEDARLHRMSLDRSVISVLHANGIRTDNNLLLRGVRITGTGENGAIRLLGAHIGGQLNLDRVTITNATGPVLVADGIRTGGHMFLRDVHFTGTGENGAIRLLGADIGGQLDLDRATITNTAGPVLDAEGIRAGGHMFLRDVHFTGTGENGAIRLLGADIGGQLDLDRATITNTAGPALVADGIRSDNTMFLRDVHFTGTGENGAIRLLGADIGGQLDLDRATITNATGPVLVADGIRTGGHMFLRDAHFTGTGENGAIRLLGADISGQLDLDRATITNTAGPALVADGIHIGDNLFLRDAHITATGKKGAVWLVGARVSGQAHLTSTQLINDTGALLDLTEAQVDRGMFFSVALVCPRSRSEVSDHPCIDGARRMAVGGLVFKQLRDVTWREWLHLLVHHTSGYLPQPYQQLAAVERAAGHDNNARTILITQQHDLRRRTPDALGGTLARARHWLWGWLGRYGYRAHRLVTALLIVLVVAGATGYTAGQITTRPTHHAAERVQPPTTPTTAPGIPCSTAELIGLGIDRGLPVGATGLRARCDLDTATRWGQAFTYLLWALQALLWALATLTIAAYTGLIRKNA